MGICHGYCDNISTELILYCCIMHFAVSSFLALTMFVFTTLAGIDCLRCLQTDHVDWLDFSSLPKGHHQGRLSVPEPIQICFPITTFHLSRACKQVSFLLFMFNNITIIHNQEISSLSLKMKITLCQSLRTSQETSISQYIIQSDMKCDYRSGSNIKSKKIKGMRVSNCEYPRINTVCKIYNMTST